MIYSIAKNMMQLIQLKNRETDIFKFIMVINKVKII